MQFEHGVEGHVRLTGQDRTDTTAAPAPSAAQGLDFKLFGHFAVSWRGVPIEVKSRKSKALLGYLALSDGRSESRERLCGLLWSETDEARARQSLRQSLHEIRQGFAAAGVDAMLTDRLIVGLTVDRSSVDVVTVVESARRGDPDPVLFDSDHVFETLLEQFENVDPAFRTWLLPRRRSLELRVTADLEKHVASGRSPALIEAAARALLRLDPTNEQAMRARMRARAEQGDTGGALALYRAFWNLLDAEYGQEPSAETQALAVRVKLSGDAPAQANAGSRSRSASRLGSAPHEPAADAAPALKLTVSVGPFDASGVTTKRRYLVKGFRRALVASLVRFREWSVRDTADEPESTEPARADMGNGVRLDAHAVGDRDVIRLVLVLQQARNREYIWSNEIELGVASWSEAQALVVRRLAAALQVSVSARRLEAIRRHDVGPPLVYDQWLKGQDRILSWQPSAWAEAEHIFRELISIAPGFAPAYSSLAQLENTMPFAHPGVARDRDRALRALSHAQQATRIDPVDSRAQLALGWSCLMAEQYDCAMEHASLALELNDTDQLTALSTAQCLAFCGEHPRAAEIVVRARRIIPTLSRLHWAYLVGIRFLAGDYAGAVEASHNESTLIPTLTGFRIAALQHLGEHAQADAERRAYMDALRERWAARSKPTDAAIRAWFLAATPMRREADRERLRAGFDGERGAA